MAKTKINCFNCDQEAYVENKEIKRGFGKFCSRTCSSKYRAKNLPPLENNVTCAYCNIPFHLSKSKQDNSKSGLYFCCREHKDAAQCIGGIKEIMPPHYGTGSPENTYRRIVFSVYNKPKICERCGFDEHEAAIIVHHKDRNRNNNDISNLEVLCANCHAIEHWGDNDIKNI